MSESLDNSNNLVNGQFVITPYGIGKILSDENGELNVEFLDVVGEEPIAKSLKRSDCQLVDWNHSGTRTRVWMKYPSETYGYRGGYIQGAAQGTMLVSLHGGEKFQVDEDELFIRWDHPLEKCDVALANGAVDSWKFYARKILLLQNLLQQRNVCRGYSAILSSPVRPFQHQLNVMARVLGDPVMRFILADEVGLGKTIEAGLIIRQFLLDSGMPNVAISVPRLLKRQWENELREKFALSAYIDQQKVRIYSHEEIEQIKDFGPDLLVIDEAHQLSHIVLKDDNSSRSLKELTVTVPRLLLLTATPLRGNASTFFALLHLIDPLAYPIESESRFTRDLKEREENANAIEVLDPQSPIFAVQDTVRILLDSYPQDSYLQNMGDELLASMEGENGVTEELSEKIIEFRSYLRETYRLSRRVIRNRRSEVVGVDGFRVSGRNFEIMAPEVDNGSSGIPSSDFLEEYRSMLLESEDEDNGPVLFRQMLERTIAGPEAVLGLLEMLLSNTSQNQSTFNRVTAAIKNQELIHEWGSNSVKVSERWRLFLDHCRTVFESAGNGCVVFTSFNDTAKRFEEILRQELGPHAVAHHFEDDSPEAQEQAVEKFLSNQECRVLVCDGSAEEGRNFQDTQKILHLDIPLSFNKFEQRIGRTDRFREAGSSGVVSYVFSDPDNEWLENHLSLLRSAIGILEDSVATLHHPLADLEERLVQQAFENGLNGFHRDITSLREELEEERELIDFLEDVESSSTDSDISRQDMEELIDFEEAWGDTKIAFENFTRNSTGLSFKSSLPDPDDPTIFEYKTLTERNTPHVRLNFLDLIAPHLLGLRTFNRVVARRNKGVRLMRIGDPFVDWLENYVQIDERGRARVLWRQIPTMERSSVFFRFDFQVEFNNEFLSSIGFENLRRRGDLLLPPNIVSVVTTRKKIRIQDSGSYRWGDHRVASETPTTAILDVDERLQKLPDHVSNERVGWQNVKSEKWSLVLREFPNWKELCTQAGELARREAINDPRVKEILNSAKIRSERDLERREAIIKTRSQYFGSNALGQVSDVVSDEIAILEAVTSGVTNPTVNMVAAGAYIQSPYSIEEPHIG